MKIICGLILGALALALVDCAPSFVETTHLNAAPHPLVPRSPGSVEVYSSTPPTRPHVDVALLRVHRANGFGRDTALMVQSLLELAAKSGCDALFISGATERGSDVDAFDEGSQSLLGTCVAYLPEGAVTLPPSPGPRPAANAIVLVPHEAPRPAPVVVVDSISANGARR